jgi:uncharacterized protein YukE
MAAAREERAAHAALQQGIKPLHPSWCEDDEEPYQARLARWRTASRALVDALDRAGSRRSSDGVRANDVVRKSAGEVEEIAEKTDPRT